MEPIYEQTFPITDACVDRYGRLKPSMILFFSQVVTGQHCKELSVGHEALAAQRLFWAVTRHRVQITRLPHIGETIRLETWPMPTTRVAYPRSVVAYDEAGNEVFRSVSVYVLVNLDTRNMILPGKSGIVVSGTLRGDELALPRSLHPARMQRQRSRIVRFTDLDRNGHMNNTRYLDWVGDLIPSSFHCDHPVKEFTVCYHAEALEEQEISLNWTFMDGPSIQVEGLREMPDGAENHVFTCRVLFD